MKKSLAAAWIVIALGMSVAAYAQNTALRVGAAKVDVTPAQADLPKNYDGILDHIYSRAIVIDNGSATAALITVDAGGVPDAIWQAVSKQLESELGIPAKNVLLTATHSHSVPGQPAGPYTQKIVESVRLAKQRLAPARIGYGTGVSYINVNRNIIDPKTKRWWEGPNYEGPSDKTVAVIKFESLSGEPLAVYYNYAMHGVAAGQLDLVSGDAPGTTSKYIEDSFDDKVVALWSSGAAGDQNPIYFQQTYDLREIRIKDYAKRGQDISNSMPPGGQGLDQEGPHGDQADEPAKANDPVHGAVPGRRGDARDARHGPDGAEHSDRRPVQNCQLPGARAHERWQGGFPGGVQGGWSGGHPAGTASGGGHHDRRRERRGIQSDRPTSEEGIALCADHDGDSDQWIGALRLHPTRCRLRDVYV